MRTRSLGWHWESPGEAEEVANGVFWEWSFLRLFSADWNGELDLKLSLPPGDVLGLILLPGDVIELVSPPGVLIEAGLPLGDMLALLCTGTEED